MPYRQIDVSSCLRGDDCSSLEQPLFLSVAVLPMTIMPTSSCSTLRLSTVMGAALLANLSMMPFAQASDSSQLISLINQYRAAPQRCNGQRTAPAGPLAANEKLAQVRLSQGMQLREVLRGAGYQAAQVQAMAISAPAGAEAAMQVLTQSYCKALLDSHYAEVGVSRSGNRWQIVLAQPVLSGNIGDWQSAGKEVLRLVNEARAKPRRCGNQSFKSAKPLTWDAKLANAALAHSREMASLDYFSHAGKDGSQVDKRAQQQGYQWRRIGENIAGGPGSPKQVVSGWLASPGHCSNIMNPDYTQMGTAYAVNPKSSEVIYWTQVFGTPR